MRFFTVVCSALVLASGAQAQNNQESLRKWSNLTVTVKEIPNSSKTDAELIANLPTVRQTMGGVLDVPTEVIPVPAGTLGPIFGAAAPEVEAWLTIGMKAWELVKANKPVVNVNLAKISILPEATPKWTMMENWKVGTSTSYELAATNGFGMKVVNFTYRISYNYGGQYEGAGMFLANVMVLPETIDVIWGYNLDANVELGEPVNVGTLENQIPGIQIQVKHKIETVLRSTQGSSTYFVSGKGQLLQLN